MSALSAHTHLLTSIKIQVMHAVDALEAKVSKWLVCQFTTQNLTIVQAVEDARSAADQTMILTGIVADLRIQLDHAQQQLAIERKQRRDVMRAFEARLQQLESDSPTRRS